MNTRLEKREQGGFAQRLREVVDAHGSASALAKTIGRSEGAVRKWLRGESEPDVTDLRSICEATRTSVEWLVTGRGQRECAWEAREAPAAPYASGSSSPLDYSLLERILEELDHESRAAEVELPSTKRSALVVTLYDLFREKREVDRAAIARLLKLAT